MKRVIVIGSGGAGKSTFSKRLGEILRIDVHHLDALYWHPGWVETPKPEWKKIVEDLIQRETWIIDGNYSGTLELRLKACDTVIFLDVMRTVCLWRVLKRAILYRNERRPDMAKGCDERLDLQFMRWIWNYPKRTRAKVLGRVEESPPGVRVIRLRT